VVIRSFVKIQISQGYVNGSDLLLLSGVNPGITSNWSAAQGALTLNGPATFAQFETAIENILFQTTQTVFTEDRFFSINLGVANFLPSTGHYYFYVADLSITWSEAETAAESQDFFGLQGYLATITSEEESQLAGEQSSGAGQKQEPYFGKVLQMVIHKMVSIVFGIQMNLMILAGMKIMPISPILV